MTRSLGIVEKAEDSLKQMGFIRLIVQLQLRLFFFLISKQSMNGARIYFSDQNLSNNTLVEGTNSHFEHLFKTFIHNFIRQNTRIYQKQLEAKIRDHKYFLEVEVADLRSFDEQLYERLESAPLEVLSVMEASVRSYLKERIEQYSLTTDQEWQVKLYSNENSTRIRDIKSDRVSRLFVVNGIIISTTKPYIKASRLKIQCRHCGNTKAIDLQPGQWPYVPTFCEGIAGRTQKCPKDSFVALPTSDVIDTQNMKIQENPDEVPTGEVARTYTLVADRRNVSICRPGERVQVTGVMLVNDARSDQLTRGYIYVTGIKKIIQREQINYTPAEEEQFKIMSKDPELLQKIYKSIAPGIYGNDEIKSAIACMLFGGSRKMLPDNTILRGDINVLLIGDPSTAKSQFLKFVEQTSAIAVYTSGKGSSAAGLTASITKDANTGEFQIEGGALVLADGGIVCIDEFDKMKPADRVAIHEAMQQQTISVAKAGITTRLNSRTSVLAAANPIFGRFDDFKMLEQQIELKSTILSRFDCIFVVRDINNPESNERIANHIMDIHQGKASKNAETSIPFDILKKYIKYARNKVQPRLSALAAEKLTNQYVNDRQKAKESTKVTHSSSPIPITVRQLEAVIRLSESLAKMRLKSEVSLQEVQAAHYLFEISTMKTIQGSRQFGSTLSQGAAVEIQKAEDFIRKRMHVGNQVSTLNLMNDMEIKFNMEIAKQAVHNMIKNQQLKEAKGRKILVRER